VSERLEKDYLTVGREMAEGKHLDIAKDVFKGDRR